MFFVRKYAERGTWFCWQIFSDSSLNKQLLWLIFWEAKSFCRNVLLWKTGSRHRWEICQGWDQPYWLGWNSGDFEGLACVRSGQRWLRIKASLPYSHGLVKVALGWTIAGKKPTFILCSNLASIGWSKLPFLTFKAHNRASRKVTFPNWCAG